MCLLQFEADRRAFTITVNSFGTDLSGADRSELYPSCGKLYPEGLQLLAKAEDPEQVKAVAECYPVSLTFFVLFRLHYQSCCIVCELFNLGLTYLQEYKIIFDDPEPGSDFKTLEDRFFEQEVI